MKYLLSAAALLAAVVVADKRDLCSEGSVDDNGNWYCQQVTGITYTGVGGSGSYNKVTNMNSAADTCSSTPQSYSGSLAPLDEEVSVHFRGPIQLKQFAVYTPSGGSSKKQRRSSSSHARRHAHAHGHAHAHAEEAKIEAREAAVGEVVTATIDGVVVSWINEYSGGAATSAASSAAATTAAATTAAASSPSTAAAYVASSSKKTSTKTSTKTSAKKSASSAAKSSATTAAYVASSSKKSSTKSAAKKVASSAAKSSAASSAAAPASSSSSSSGSSSSSSGSGWSRQGYYSSSGSSSGLVFLNHNGGSGSGVFDYSFGNSLSYATSDGMSGSSSPQTLADTTLPETGEVVIMSDTKCSGQNGDCGYYRPGTVAHHGFSGAEKVFLFEFAMPDNGKTSGAAYTAVNMPAIWLLNAQIPRTLQYGSAACSCWTTGCGEFDVFEVLAPGDKRAKSTLHGNIAGGDSDYFARPESGPIKLALVLSNNQIHIQVLDSSTTFGSSVSSSFINSIISSTSTQTSSVSLFALSG